MIPAGHSRLFRFVIVGGANTALTYALYLALTHVVVPSLAYATSYLLGVGISFIGNRSWVFESQRSCGSFGLYVCLQAILLGVGSAISWLLMGHLQPWLIGCIAISLVVPLSFFANRRFFGARPNQ